MSHNPKPKQKTVMFDWAGSTAVFIGRKQVPELQFSWLKLWAEHAERAGYDPTEFLVELPSGHQAKFYRQKNGKLNWEVL